LTYTPTITDTPTSTPTFTLTPIYSYTPSNTPTITFTPSLTPTWTATLTPTFTPQCSIGYNGMVQSRLTGKSYFTFTFTLSNPPVQYYLNTLNVTLAPNKSARIAKIFVNNFDWTEPNTTYPTGSDIIFTLRYIQINSGLNTLYIEYDGNIGSSDHTSGVALTLWNVAGITQCDQVIYP
jgi:hypothetical protein